MAKYKRIGASGGVTIPADVRRDYGFVKGDGVSVTVEGGAIVIRKYTPSCFFCGDQAKKKFKGRYICIACAQEIAKEVCQDG